MSQRVGPVSVDVTDPRPDMSARGPLAAQLRVRPDRSLPSASLRSRPALYPLNQRVCACPLFLRILFHSDCGCPRRLRRLYYGQAGHNSPRNGGRVGHAHVLCQGERHLTPHSESPNAQIRSALRFASATARLRDGTLTDCTRTPCGLRTPSHRSSAAATPVPRSSPSLARAARAAAPS